MATNACPRCRTHLFSVPTPERRTAPADHIAALGLSSGEDDPFLSAKEKGDAEALSRLQATRKAPSRNWSDLNKVPDDTTEFEELKNILFAIASPIASWLPLNVFEVAELGLAEAAAESALRLRSPKALAGIINLIRFEDLA